MKRPVKGGQNGAIERTKRENAASEEGGHKNSSDEWKGHAFMALLALQYGCQPIFSKLFIRPTVIKTSAVLTTELVKAAVALAVMLVSGTWATNLKSWTIYDTFSASALPAAIYAFQNVLVQVAYQNLEYLTFSMLNQTKLLFTALFMFIMLRHRQSLQQLGALFVMLVAAVLLSLDQAPSSASATMKPVDPDLRLYRGVIPLLTACVLSGIASSLCQKASQVKARSSLMMTVEMSIIGSALLLVSLKGSKDGEIIQAKGFLHGWTPLTLVPVVSNALGGILVGLVTKYAGGVRKGFAIILALLVTAFIQLLMEGALPSTNVLLALPLVLSSLVVHLRYPYRTKTKQL